MDRLMKAVRVSPVWSDPQYEPVDDGYPPDIDVIVAEMLPDDPDAQDWQIRQYEEWMNVVRNGRRTDRYVRVNGHDHEYALAT